MLILHDTNAALSFNETIISCQSYFLGHHHNEDGIHVTDRFSVIQSEVVINCKVSRSMLCEKKDNELRSVNQSKGVAIANLYNCDTRRSFEM